MAMNGPHGPPFGSLISGLVCEATTGSSLGRKRLLKAVLKLVPGYAICHCRGKRRSVKEAAAGGKRQKGSASLSRHAAARHLTGMPA
jgi:hypothetical protein